jgi:hypothetical protein
MLIYDDTAAGALTAAADEARLHGSNGYGTEHVLLGLLRTGDPVTRRVTDEAPQLTVETVRAALTWRRPALVPSGSSAGQGRLPAPDFRRAMSDFTAVWRPLVRASRLRAGRRLGSAELWLAVLEPSAAASGLLRSVGVDPDDVRTVVLATMVPDAGPVPRWEAPARTGSGLLARVLRRGRTGP